MIQLYAILDCDHKKMNNLQLPQKDREKEIVSLDSFIKSDIAFIRKMRYDITELNGVKNIEPQNVRQL
jgi:hypothetical protein